MHEDMWFHERMAEGWRQDRLREAETLRLLRDAGVSQRGWPARQAAWVVRQVGTLLVALGQWLARFDPSLAYPAAVCGLTADPGCQGAQ